jgi:sulfite reductase (NADPH) flavoprotein alpha-component
MDIQKTTYNKTKKSQNVALSPTTSSKNSETLHILFGSRTGNSKSAAELASQYATYLGIQNKLVDLKTLSLTQFSEFKNTLLAVSTHGEGDPPSVVEEFYFSLHGARVPKMDNLKFSILALGDSSYKDFCKTGNDFRERFLGLNATEVFPIVECDIDYEEKATDWVKNSVDTFAKILPARGETKGKVFSFEINKRESDWENVYYAKVLSKKLLTNKDHKKKVIHLELSMDNFNNKYYPGDTFGIYMNNSRLLTDKLIKQLKFDRSYVIRKGDNKKLLKDTLLTDYEITLLTPVVLSKYAKLIGSKALDQLIGNKEQLKDYCRTRDVIDLVKDYPGNFSPDEFLSVLRNLTPRLYSVASSTLAFPNELHLTVGIIENSIRNRKHTGVCSTYINDRVDIGDSIPIALERNESFRLVSDDSIPIIMIATSTGIAPFRAFLQERHHMGAKGDNWLFFGDRHQESDFLYEEDIGKFLKNGLLTKLNTAFSRDGDKKEYVQHQLLNHSKELFEWIDKRNAVIYLCGNKWTMGKDVKTCLEQIVSLEGKMSQSEASAYLHKMKSAKRYQMDLY